MTTNSINPTREINHIFATGMADGALVNDKSNDDGKTIVLDKSEMGRLADKIDTYDVNVRAALWNEVIARESPVNGQVRVDGADAIAVQNSRAGIDGVLLQTSNDLLRGAYALWVNHAGDPIATLPRQAYLQQQLDQSVTLLIPRGQPGQLQDPNGVPSFYIKVVQPPQGDISNGLPAGTYGPFEFQLSQTNRDRITKAFQALPSDTSQLPKILGLSESQLAADYTFALDANHDAVLLRGMLTTIDKQTPINDVTQFYISDHSGGDMATYGPFDIPQP